MRILHSGDAKLDLDPFLLSLPASTSVFAVPARSSYSFLKSSTDGFFISSLPGTRRSLGVVVDGDDLDESNEGMRSSRPGDGVLAFGT
jgi:hypothetical protein